MAALISCSLIHKDSFKSELSEATPVKFRMKKNKNYGAGNEPFDMSLKQNLDCSTGQAAAVKPLNQCGSHVKSSRCKQLN